jgi:hypothetical protein
VQQVQVQCTAVCTADLQVQQVSIVLHP